MDYLKQDNYDINAADIWEYECGCYLERKRDKDQMTELYEFLRKFYLEAKHPPIIDAAVNNEDFTKYRELYINGKDDEVCWQFFLWDAKVYSMNRRCVVSLKGHNHLAFQRLFILKLLQYRDALLYIEPFLKYQLITNFKNKLANFQKFMKVSLLQYPNAIDATIIKTVEEWFLEMGKKKSEKALKPKSKRKRKFFDEQIKTADTEVADSNLDDDSTNHTDDSNSSPVQNNADDVSSGKNENNKEVDVENKLEESEPEKQEVETPSDGSEGNILSDALPVELEKEETIPTGYKIVEGEFTKEEVLQFFSFLYKEKSREGKTFLTEKEVTEIFKYGLAIPPEPPAKKYKLNCSLTFPKNIVEFYIYKFYSNHTASKHKKDVLKFFASYIIDFEKALLSESAMQTWSGNVVGKMSPKINFAIADYLPERFRYSNKLKTPGATPLL